MRDPHVHLTEEEQRQLNALEAATRRDDPRFDRRLRHGRRIPVIRVVVIGWPLPALPTGLMLIAAGLFATLGLLLSVGGWWAFAGYPPMVVGALFALDAPVVRRWLRSRFRRGERSAR